MKSNNYRFRIWVKPEKIYANLTPEQRNQIGSIIITNATLLSCGDVELECLALENEVEDIPSRFIVNIV